jgi:hypothetical protein
VGPKAQARPAPFAWPGAVPRAAAAPKPAPAPGRAPRMPSASESQAIASASLLELRLRSGGAGPWQASNRPGETLAGSEVKEQFQRQMAQEIWKKRAMSRRF